MDAPRSPLDASPLRASPTYVWAKALQRQPLAGRYALLRIIGRGGASVVFAADDTLEKRRVAVKVLAPREPTRAHHLLRFEREGQIAAKLKHPHIVNLLDIGRDERGVAFLVSELLDGSTLKDVVREHGPFSPGEALRTLLPVLGAVAFAHSEGVLHRDLKPENIFLIKDGAGHIVPKLLDFGIAKSFEEDTFTTSGAVIGTPAFMSPEQALAEPLTRASDVWSLGAVFFFALTGEPPFRADSLTSLLLTIVNKPAPLLRSVRADLPTKLTAAVDRALRRGPASRYEDVPTFARALLETALDDGVDLPEDPDPIGLPNFRDWHQASLLHTTQQSLRGQPSRATTYWGEAAKWAAVPLVIAASASLAWHALASRGHETRGDSTTRLDPARLVHLAPSDD